MLKYLLSVSLVVLACSLPIHAASPCYPDSVGQKMRYEAMIEMDKGYLSGICILSNEGKTVMGSLFNEFGISALDFSYNVEKDKIKLINVVGFLNKWYIRRTLRKDLAILLHRLQEGKNEYRNSRHNIHYKFIILPNHDIEE